jgi:two-component system OmpR family response regulator
LRKDPRRTDEPSAGSPSARPLVLVVDDDQDIAESICDVLSGSGYEVQVAHAGEPALALARQHRVCLVLLDWRLPGTPVGGSLVRKLRDASGFALPVVVLSADPSSLVEAREAEVSDYLPKPFDIADLLHLVDVYCPA